MKSITDLEVALASLQTQLDRATGIIDEQRAVIQRLSGSPSTTPQADGDEQLELSLTLLRRIS